MYCKNAYYQKDNFFSNWTYQIYSNDRLSKIDLTAFQNLANFKGEDFFQIGLIKSIAMID